MARNYIKLYWQLAHGELPGASILATG
jgi:hypothetical protein